MLNQSLILPKQRLIPQSFGRTLVLLTEFGTHGNRGARFTDLIAETNVATATFRRLLAAMIRKGFLEQDALTFVPSTVVAPHLEAARLHSRVSLRSPARSASSVNRRA